MFGLNFFDIHILQEYKRKTNSVKTTQDVIDGASAAVADGQFSRGIQASIFPRRQKIEKIFRRMILSFGYHSQKCWDFSPVFRTARINY